MISAKEKISSHAPKILLALLAFLAIARFAEAYPKIFFDYDYVDFRNPYLGARMMLRGENFYNDSLLKAEWKKISSEEKIFSTKEPGFPSNMLLYPPWAIPAFVPFTKLPWTVAKNLWTVLYFVLFFPLMLYFVLKLEPRKFLSVALIFLLTIAFKGTLQCFVTGQPLIPCLAAGFAALHFSDRKKFFLAGILIGIASIKITVALPFFLFLLYKRNFRSPVIGALTAGIFLVITLGLSHDPAELIRSYFATMDEFNNPASEAWRYDHTMMTELGEFVYFAPHLQKFLPVIYGSIALIAGLTIWRFGIREKKISDLHVFCILSALSLVVMYHLHYDMLLLIPIFFLVKNFSLRWKIFFFAAAAFLYMPVVKVVRILPFDILSPVLLTYISAANFVLLSALLLHPHLSKQQFISEKKFL